MKKFIMDMLSSSQGHLSSKRVMGTISFLTALGCIMYLTVSEGGTVVVENLLLTLIIMSASLLGLENITNIWKGNNKTTKPEN